MNERFVDIGAAANSADFLNRQGKSLADRSCILKVEDGKGEFRFNAYDMFERYPYGDSMTVDRCVLPGSGLGLVDRVTCVPVQDAPNPLKDNPVVRGVERDPLGGTLCVVSFDTTATREQLQDLDHALLDAAIGRKTMKLSECQAELEQSEEDAKTCEKEVMLCSAKLATCHDNMLQQKRQYWQDQDMELGQDQGQEQGYEQGYEQGQDDNQVAAPDPAKLVAIKSTAMFDTCLRVGPDADKVTTDTCTAYDTSTAKLWSVPDQGKWGPVQSGDKCMRVDPASGAVAVTPCSSGDDQQTFVHNRGRLESKATIGKCMQVMHNSSGVSVAECSDDQKQVFRLLDSTNAQAQRVMLNRDLLRGDQILKPGKALTSDNGHYNAIYTADRGELKVVNDRNETKWSANARLPANRSPGHCKLHPSGLLTLVDSTGMKYWSNRIDRVRLTRANFPCQMQLGDDGILRITDETGALMWNS